MHDEPEVAMVAMLSASLALVRPVGFTAQETAEWLDVAFDAVSHLPYEIFEKGAKAARRTCTHHSQIIPAIISETKDAMAWHNRERPIERRLRLVSPESEIVDPAPKEPPPDPNTLMPTLRRMGLSKGWIIERNGQLEWAEDSAA